MMMSFYKNTTTRIFFFWIALAGSFSLFFFQGCTFKKPPSTTEKPSFLAKNFSKTLAWLNQTDRRKKSYKKNLHKALVASKECKNSDPWVCRYYFALFSGLEIEINPLGYEKKLYQMVLLLKEIANTKPKLDNAGAYRVLAEIYSQAPKTITQPKAILRDYPTAKKYAQKAIVISPDHAENWLIYLDILVRDQDKKSWEVCSQIAQHSVLKMNPNQKKRFKKLRKKIKR